MKMTYLAGIPLAVIIPVALPVAIGIFFLVRWIVLWYFKINAMLKELKQMNCYLGWLVTQAQAGTPQVVVKPLEPMQASPVMPSEPVQASPVMPSEPVQVSPVMPSEPVQVSPVMPSEPVPSQPMIQPMPQSGSWQEESQVLPAMGAAVSVRICKKCGAELRADASFCMQCGTKYEG